MLWDNNYEIIKHNILKQDGWSIGDSQFAHWHQADEIELKHIQHTNNIVHGWLPFDC